MISVTCLLCNRSVVSAAIPILKQGFQPLNLYSFVSYLSLLAWRHPPIDAGHWRPHNIFNKRIYPALLSEKTQIWKKRVLKLLDFDIPREADVGRNGELPLSAAALPFHDSIWLKSYFSPNGVYLLAVTRKRSLLLPRKIVTWFGSNAGFVRVAETTLDRIVLSLRYSIPQNISFV